MLIIHHDKIEQNERIEQKNTDNIEITHIIREVLNVAFKGNINLIKFSILNWYIYAKLTMSMVESAIQMKLNWIKLNQEKG